MFSNDGRVPARYRGVRATFARVATTAGLKDVRLHDLRRTVMTMAAASGVSAHVLRDLLEHKTAEMADRYIVALSSPVRDARERVASEIASIMAGDTAEIVTLRRDD